MEQKFRVWDKRNNKMYFVDSDSIALGVDGSVLTIRVDYHSIINGKDAILMHWTGDKDKNGKEIYKDDIVEFEGSVIKIFYGLYPGASNSAMVLGNIHENPEYLPC